MDLEMMNESSLSEAMASSVAPDQTSLLIADWINGIYISVGALGVLDNALVIFVLIYTPGMLESSVNILIMNQSILDALSGAFIVLGIIFNDPYGMPDGPVGHIYCLLWISKYQQWACFFSSTYNLVVMNYDRCFAISYPMWYLKVYSKRKLYIIIGLVWLSGIMFYLPYTILTYKLENNTCLILSLWYLSWGKALAGVLVFVFLYIIPMFLVGFAFYKIYNSLNVKTTLTGDPEAKDSGESRTIKKDKQKLDKRDLIMIRARRNVLKTLLYVYIALLICWTSDQIYFLIWNVGVDVAFGNWFYHLNVNLVFFNCCVNPFIYAFMYKPFKDALKQIFCTCRR